MPGGRQRNVKNKGDADALPLHLRVADEQRRAGVVVECDDGGVVEAVWYGGERSERQRDNCWVGGGARVARGRAVHVLK